MTEVLKVRIVSCPVRFSLGLFGSGLGCFLSFYLGRKDGVVVEW